MLRFGGHVFLFVYLSFFMPAIFYKHEYLYQNLALFLAYFKLHFQDNFWEVL